MDPLTLLASAGELFAAHPELVKDIVDLFKSGADMNSVRQAIRGVKAEVSLEAIKEEMGVGP